MYDANTALPSSLSSDDPLLVFRQREFSEAVATAVPLNHAGVSPSPACVVHAVEHAIRAMAREPLPFFMETLLPAMTSARTKLANLMGVPEEHLAFVKNTGHALSIVADGLMLEAGDNVVTAACEYPAVVYPWYGQAWRGIETRLVQTRANGTLHPDDFAAKMDNHTRVVALSWVQFGTGFRADVKAFADMAHRHGAILVLDVIQALGALPCDAVNWGADVVASGMHKWMMSPSGIGGLYISPQVMEKMHLVNMGAGSVTHIMQFDSTLFTPKTTAQRYEEGSPNSLGLVGLNAALGMIEEAGIERMGERVLALGDLTARAVTAKGYEVVTPRGPDGRLSSALVMFRHPSHSNSDIMAALAEAHVAAADRGGSIRFSPHFYNNESDIEKAVAALPG